MSLSKASGTQDVCNKGQLFPALAGAFPLREEAQGADPACPAPCSPTSPSHSLPHPRQRLQPATDADAAVDRMTMRPGPKRAHLGT